MPVDHGSAWNMWAVHENPVSHLFDHLRERNLGPMPVHSVADLLSWRGQARTENLKFKHAARLHKLVTGTGFCDAQYEPDPGSDSPPAASSSVGRAKRPHRRDAYECQQNNGFPVREQTCSKTTHMSQRSLTVPSDLLQMMQAESEALALARRERRQVQPQDALTISNAASETVMQRDTLMEDRNHQMTIKPSVEMMTVEHLGGPQNLNLCSEDKKEFEDYSNILRLSLRPSRCQQLELLKQASSVKDISGNVDSIKHPSSEDALNSSVHSQNRGETSPPSLPLGDMNSCVSRQQLEWASTWPLKEIEGGHLLGSTVASQKAFIWYMTERYHAPQRASVTSSAKQSPVELCRPTQPPTSDHIWSKIVALDHSSNTRNPKVVRCENLDRSDCQDPIRDWSKLPQSCAQPLTQEIMHSVLPKHTGLGQGAGGEDICLNHMSPNSKSDMLYSDTFEHTDESSSSTDNRAKLDANSGRSLSEPSSSTGLVPGSEANMIDPSGSWIVKSSDHIWNDPVPESHATFGGSSKVGWGAAPAEQILWAETTPKIVMTISAKRHVGNADGSTGSWKTRHSGSDQNSWDQALEDFEPMSERISQWIQNTSNPDSHT